ncbi:MAG: hypothetical protein C5B47_03885 [Verrucomicrobia bacterium]|nr:MAG: hypothetical protein C5B47_03885 [Verrucomicrobiota bacterium]
MTWAIFAFSTLLIAAAGLSITYRDYKAISKNVDDISKQVSRLQNSLPPASSFPRITAQSKEYAHEGAKLIGMLPQFPKQPTTPQLFQDKLRERVSTIIAKASGANVGFPPNFYLGFDAYRATLPSQRMTSQLDRELEVIFTLVSQLIDLRVLDILRLYRFPSAEESPVASWSSRTSKEHRIFDLCFASDQQTLREILNFVLKFPYLMSIEAMQVISSSDTQPKKCEAKIDGIPMRTPASQNAASPKIKLLFEKERLLVTLRIAMSLLYSETAIK